MVVRRNSMCTMRLHNYRYQSEYPDNVHDGVTVVSLYPPDLESRESCHAMDMCAPVPTVHCSYCWSHDWTSRLRVY